MKIQTISIENPESSEPTVEVLISDSLDPEESDNYLIGRVKIHRKGKSLENVQLDTLDQLRGLIEQAEDLVDKTVSERN